MSYYFDDNFNNDAFFWWEKNLIKHRQWSALPQASKSVFPVIACHANKAGISYPSEDRIAALSGLTPKTVRSGINGLKDFCGIEWEPYITARGRYSKKIKITLPKKNNKDCFPFFQVVLEYGSWHELSPSAKALYPVMRCFSAFDLDEYAEHYDQDVYDARDIYLDYSHRKYDHCIASKAVLAEHAGISRRQVNSTLDNLTECYLIEPDNNDGWRVFLRSNAGWYFKREYLNEKVIRMRKSNAA